MSYDYPGNVRELLNLLERTAVLGETDLVELLDNRVADGPTDDVSDEHVFHQGQETLLRVDVRDVRAERLVGGAQRHPPDEVQRRHKRRVLLRRAAAEHPARPPIQIDICDL